MRIVYLGNMSPVLTYLYGHEDAVCWASEPGVRADWLISYGYRRILTPDELAQYPHAINLHISLLPWNRGADPNYWSWRDKTPRGVSIAYIDSGIDTGPILAQREVAFGPDETLKSSYARLHREMADLFVSEWPRIRNAPPGAPQTGTGSFHRVGEMPDLPEGWDTAVERIGT